MPLEFGCKINYNEDEHELTTFLMQTRALLWKNFLLFSRKQRIVLIVLLAPVIIAWMLDVIKQISLQLHKSGRVDQEVFLIDKINPCLNGYYAHPSEEPCLTVGYSMIGESNDMHNPKYQRYHDIMSILAKNNNFTVGNQVRPLTAGKQRDLFNYIEAHPNKTKYAIAFCHEEWYEELEFSTISVDDNLFNFSQSVDQRSQQKKRKFQWQFPCSFENKDHGQKDMWAYFMYYNMSLAPSNIYS